MKRLILTVIVLAAAIAMAVPDEPNAMEELNGTAVAIEEPNEPEMTEQKSYITEKTDVRVLIKQLNRRIDALERQIRALQDAVRDHEAEIVRLGGKVTTTVKKKTSNDVPRRSRRKPRVKRGIAAP